MGIAFFDMDKTLLSESSGVLYVRYLLGKRVININEMINVLIISTQYSLNFLNFPKAMAHMSQSIKGGNASATRALCDRWFDECVVRYIAPKAVNRLREHERNGDMVILLSASTQFAVAPVARFLDIPYRCTELEIVDNKFTGQTVGMHCYGEGKRFWAEALMRDHAVPAADCVFYSDSYSDHWLMEAVGRPVAINPDHRLRELARQRRWEIDRFY